MERLLLYVEETPGAAAAANWLLKLALALSARVFALYVLPSGDRRDDEEEQAWQLLYEIEDDAFADNVRISLLLEQGDPLERLCDVCHSFRTELLAVSADTRLAIPELLRRSPHPVVLVKPPKEV